MKSLTIGRSTWLVDSNKKLIFKNVYLSPKDCQLLGRWIGAQHNINYYDNRYSINKKFRTPINIVYFNIFSIIKDEIFFNLDI